MQQSAPSPYSTLHASNRGGKKTLQSPAKQQKHLLIIQFVCFAQLTAKRMHNCFQRKLTV